MRGTQITVGSLILVGTLASGFAQPPVPGTPAIPQTPPAVLPAGGVAPVPAAGNEIPLAQFDPIAAFPQTTQNSVRAVVTGANWLARMNQPQGRFLPGYRPALRQPIDADHDLKQAKAALAMAQAARFTGNERHAAVAGQSLLALLALTKPDPADANCRIPVASSMSCNRVGFAALLALGISELPGADDKLLAEAEKLCEFLHRQLRTDGSVHYVDSPNEHPLKVDPAGVNEYPGLALQAIAVSNRVKPATWKSDALKKGLENYRAFFRANPHATLASTLLPAFTELFLQTKSNDAATAVFELADWLLALQYPAGDPRHPAWAGGFKNGQSTESEPGSDCGSCVSAAACAYTVLRFNPDLTRAAKYKAAVTDGAAFLCGLQYTEPNTRHFENGFRANTLIGGFYRTPTDGNLHVENTAAAISGLIRFLGCGAERN
jgi:hypothetical protein